MPNRAEVKMTPVEGAAVSFARSPEMRAWLGERMKAIAEELYRSAPVASGAGRASISSDVSLSADGWYGTAGWDEQHYYMGIQQARTHWADPTVAQLRYEL